MPLNFTRTALLLAMLTAIFVALGYLVGGPVGMIIAFVVAVATNVVSYWKSDTFVLRMYGAEEVDETTAPDYYMMVRDLAASAGLPLPRVYIMHNAQPNAFATGRNPDHAAVCASTGLLDTLSREEVAAVMAHELAHIKNYDTLTMTIAATVGGAISMLAQYLQFSMLFGGSRRDSGGSGVFGFIGIIAAMMLAPFAASLVQMAISRSREYQADRMGAEICGNPLWLASALRKIQGLAGRIPNEAAERAPATAHMFIINPLTGRGMDSLFSTHPSTENRVHELEKLAGAAGIHESPIGTTMTETGQARDSDSYPGPWGNRTPRSDQGGNQPQGNDSIDSRGYRPRNSSKPKRGPWG